MKDFVVSILGARGTIAHEGIDFLKYGGATSCVYINVADEAVVLDGGSGILSLPEMLGEKKVIHLLLTHMHIDHIMGIMACPLFFDKSMTINIYGCDVDGDLVKDRIDAALRPPLWPVNSDAFLAKVSYHSCNSGFFIGDVKIDCLEGFHPGGCTAYRLNYNGKSVVYATDFEITSNNIDELSDFAKDCTLLLCDGQYTEDEMKERKGFGHSSWESVCDLALNCGAKQLGIIHHDPYRTDKMLDDMQSKLRERFENSFFAHRREERSF